VMEVFSCGCCSKTLPTLHKHVHHKLPRALGGKDIPDNLIELCPACHDTLHSIAYKMLSKKSSSTQMIDSLSLIYIGNKKAQETCLQLAMAVRNAHIHAKEKGLGPNHLVNIGTTIRKYFKPLIMTRYRELNISQESYLRMLILSDLAKRFNLNVSLTQENQLLSQIKKEKSNALIERDTE